MGFFKFLKREKKEETLDELDLPPAPPPLEGFNENMPEFPDFGEEKVSAPKEEFPEFKFPEEEGTPTPVKESTEELSEFPELEEKLITAESPVSAPPAASAIPPMQAPRTMPEPEPAEEEGPIPSDVYPKIERRLFSQEKRALRERPSIKTIYVKVDNFKAMLGGINNARSDLRKSEEALVKLENIKSTKDKSFDRLRASIDDLQKKLIFVDKTLFKGD